MFILTMDGKEKAGAYAVEDKRGGQTWCKKKGKQPEITDRVGQVAALYFVCLFFGI